MAAALYNERVSTLTRFIEANPGAFLVIDYDDLIASWVVHPLHRPKKTLAAHPSAIVLRGILRKAGCYQHTVRLWEISHEYPG